VRSGHRWWRELEEAFGFPLGSLLGLPCCALVLAPARRSNASGCVGGRGRAEAWGLIKVAAFAASPPRGCAAAAGCAVVRCGTAPMQLPLLPA
jgi:hypothetical protein